MAIEDLRDEPMPGFSYKELSRVLIANDESLEFATFKSDRQMTFIAGLGDYISATPEVTPEKRQFILDGIWRHLENERKILSDRIKKLRQERT